MHAGDAVASRKGPVSTEMGQCKSAKPCGTSRWRDTAGGKQRKSTDGIRDPLVLSLKDVPVV